VVVFCLTTTLWGVSRSRGEESSPPLVSGCQEPHLYGEFGGPAAAVRNL
jgi:hypothetical protein